MTDIVPTVGRIVLYTLARSDAVSIDTTRKNAGVAGNSAQEGDVYPAIVVKTWGETPTSGVNLKVMLDGPDTFWATSVSVGEGPRTFHWMPYQKAVAAGTQAPTLHAAPAQGGAA